MHTIRYGTGDSWQVIFVIPGVVEVIATYPNQDEAMGFCAYLNGGLDPRGYHMEVTCHH